MENIINLSYNSLPWHDLKTCFLYLSIFPEDYEIKRSLILPLWSAEGFLEEKDGLTPEEVGDGYLRELANRNMIQEINLHPLGTGRIESFRLHDLIAEMLVQKAKNENLVTFLHEPPPPSLLHNKIRRISIVRRLENNPSVVDMDLSHVRSVINFVEDYSDPFCLSSTTTANRKPYLPPSMRQVRVLHLGRCFIQEVPDEISELHLLKYLSLRENRLANVKCPKWLGNKEKLQTLDFGKFSTLSTSRLNNISNLQQLRHFNVGRVKFTEGFRRHTSLQTLQGLCVPGTGEILKELGESTQLRKLRIYMDIPNPGTNNHLCHSIDKMANLISFKLMEPFLLNPEPMADLRSISSPPPHLEKMVLWCGLSGGVIPKWISSHRNIRKLDLVGSKLAEDPFQALHALPNLVELRLQPFSYVGSCLCCQDKRGFPTLKRLYLKSVAWFDGNKNRERSNVLP